MTRQAPDGSYYATVRSPTPVATSFSSVLAKDGSMNVIKTDGNGNLI